MSFVRDDRKNDILFTFFILVGLFICWKVRHALLLIYLSIVFAVVFTPAVKWAQKLRIGRWHPSAGVAVLLLVAAVLLALAAVAIFVVPSVSNDVQEMAQDLPKRIDYLKNEINKLPLGHHLISATRGGNLSSALTTSVQGLIGSVSTLTQTVTDLFLVLILTAYFIVDRERSFKWAMSMLPHEHQEEFCTAFVKGAGRMQKWLRGQALLMLILGSSSFVVFWVSGVPYFYALALFAGVANFVPVLGPIATLIVAGAIAGMASWTKLLVVVIFYLVYQQVENSYLTPHIMKSTVELPAVAVIVALAIGSALAGIAGAIVAVPTAALIATLLDTFTSAGTSESTTK